MDELIKINEKRKEAGLKQFENLFCKICKKTNTHVPYKCPDYTCYICKEKGNHFAKNCPKKPYYCQFYIKNNNADHSISNQCSQKANVLIKRTVKCLICGKFGHLACEYRSITSLLNQILF